MSLISARILSSSISTQPYAFYCWERTLAPFNGVMSCENEREEENFWNYIFQTTHVISLTLYSMISTFNSVHMFIVHYTLWNIRSNQLPSFLVLRDSISWGDKTLKRNIRDKKNCSPYLGAVKDWCWSSVFQWGMKKKPTCQGSRRYHRLQGCAIF